MTGGAEIRVGIVMGSRSDMAAGEKAPTLTELRDLLAAG